MKGTRTLSLRMAGTVYLLISTYSNTEFLSTLRSPIRRQYVQLGSVHEGNHSAHVLPLKYQDQLHSKTVHMWFGELFIPKAVTPHNRTCKCHVDLFILCHPGVLDGIGHRMVVWSPFLLWYDIFLKQLWQQEWVVLRPGPYINAETTMGRIAHYTHACPLLALILLYLHLKHPRPHNYKYVCCTKVNQNTVPFSWERERGMQIMWIVISREL